MKVPGYIRIGRDYGGTDGWYIENATGDCVLLEDGAVVIRYDRTESKLIASLGESANVPLSAVSGGSSLYGDYLTSGTAIGKGSSAPDLEEFRDGLYTNAFTGTGSQDEEGFFTIHVLHDIKVGSLPTFHVHWSHNNASPSGNVKWQIDYSVANGYENGIFGPPVSLSSTVAAGAQYAHHITSDDDMALIATPEPDSVLFCRIYRDPADAADTFADDAFLLQVDMHYELGQIGTTERNRPFTSAGF